jgi:hypothetical protein
MPTFFFQYYWKTSQTIKLQRLGKISVGVEKGDESISLVGGELFTNKGDSLLNG